VLPYIDNQDLACCQRKQCALSFKILILSSFPAVGAFDVHDQDVIRHVLSSSIPVIPLVLRHPDSFRRLLPICLRHHPKFGTEKVVEKRRFPRRLGPEDGYEVVIEASLSNLFEGDVAWE